MDNEKYNFKPIVYVDGNRFDSLEDAVEHIIKDIPCDRSKILRRYIGNLLQEIEQLNKNLIENNSDCSLCYDKNKEQLKTAKELLKFWYDDFFNTFNWQIRYERRYEALTKTKQFLKQVQFYYYNKE